MRISQGARLWLWAGRLVGTEGVGGRAWGGGSHPGDTLLGEPEAGPHQHILTFWDPEQTDASCSHSLETLNSGRFCLGQQIRDEECVVVGQDVGDIEEPGLEVGGSSRMRLPERRG